MIQSISLKTKLIVPGFILATIIILFGAIITKYQYDKIASLNQLNEKITLSNYISDTLHSLQKERGLSIGFINNHTFKDKLLEQRDITDKKINKLDLFLKNSSCKKCNIYTQEILEKTKKLTSLREKIDSSSIRYKDIIKSYSTFNDCMLNIIIKIAKSSHIPAITQNIIAYSHLLYLKENSGLLRAQGVLILSSDSLENDAIAHFIALKTLKTQNSSIFLKYASKDIELFYKESIKTKNYTDVQNLENQIIKQNFTNHKIDSKIWFDVFTRYLNTLDRISKYIKLQTTAMIAHELKDATQYFYFIISIIILGLLFFTVMLIAVLRLAKEEQRLRLSYDKYIISSITDLQGKIIDVSEAFCTISGYSRKELIGENHNIVRHPDMPKALFKELWKDIKENKSWKGKVKNLKKDGTSYWVYANIEPLKDTKGEVDSYISVRVDITENELLLEKIQAEEIKNKTQEKLMQQQHRLAQMGEMISMIAHQWRQPLSAISATSGVLSIKAKMNRLDMQTVTDLSDKITGFSQHLSSTIDDFRNFFKTNKAKQNTDFKKIIDKILKIIENSLKQKNIELKIEIDSIEEFLTFENELMQVILNLIKNAEDALLENSINNPKIIITIKDRILTLSDNAGGIPKDIIDKIFEPYFSTKTKKDGTGLGLYMSKIIIQEHCAGKIYVENEENGAKFTIILENNND